MRHRTRKCSRIKKSVVWLGGILALCVSVVLGFVLRGAIVEYYWLYRLENADDYDEAYVAAGHLGSIGSIRALRWQAERGEVFESFTREYLTSHGFSDAVVLVEEIAEVDCELIPTTIGGCLVSVAVECERLEEVKEWLPDVCLHAMDLCHAVDCRYVFTGLYDLDECFGSCGFYIDFCVRAVGSSNRFARALAAEVLGRADDGGQVAVEALKGRIDDEDEIVRYYVIDGLARIGRGRRDVFNAIVKRLVGDSSISLRAVAAESVAKFSEFAKDAVPYLRDAVKSDSKEIREAASEALERIAGGYRSDQ